MKNLPRLRELLNKQLLLPEVLLLPPIQLLLLFPAQLELQLLPQLRNMSPVNGDCTVQSLWNNVENALVNTIDFCAPLVILPTYNTTESKKGLQGALKQNST